MERPRLRELTCAAGCVVSRISTYVSYVSSPNMKGNTFCKSWLIQFFVFRSIVTDVLCICRRGGLMTKTATETELDAVRGCRRLRVFGINPGRPAFPTGINEARRCLAA